MLGWVALLCLTGSGCDRNTPDLGPADGSSNYFPPTNLEAVAEIVGTRAAIPGATIRVSGQCHSQPPLVADDHRDGAEPTATHCIIDLSCFRDLGGNQNLAIVPDGRTEPRARQCRCARRRAA